MSAVFRRVLRVLLVGAGVLAVLFSATPAQAHGMSSVAFADLSSGGTGVVRAQLQLEYDLLVVSAADAAQDDPLFQAGTAAFEAGDAAQQVAALEQYRDDVASYVGRHFRIAGDGGGCTPTLADGITMTQQEGVPYAVLEVDYACPPSENGHEVVSTLFPDDEGFVTDTKTILTYALDIHEGSTVLDAEHPSFTTAQSTLERFWEFFRLGAEHLLSGIDHILFLLSLIVG